MKIIDTHQPSNTDQMHAISKAIPTGPYQPQIAQSLFLGKPCLLSIKQQCSDFFAALGYEYYSYQGYFPKFDISQQICEFPENWSSVSNTGHPGINSPITKYAQTRTTPSYWKDIASDSVEAKGHLSTLLQCAEENEIYNAQCFPVHGAGAEWGMLNVANNVKSRVINTDTIQQLKLLAFSLHEAVKILNENQLNETMNKAVLSPRERECLDWTAAGKTAWETAKIIGITESTVSFHIRNTISKLNANNRSHAVAVGIAKSLITV